MKNVMIRMLSLLALASPLSFIPASTWAQSSASDPLINALELQKQRLENEFNSTAESLEASKPDPKMQEVESKIEDANVAKGDLYVAKLVKHDDALAQHHYLRSKQLYQEALQLDPTNAEALRGLAKLESIMKTN